MGYHSVSRGGYVLDHHDSFEDFAEAINELLEPFHLKLHSQYGDFQEFPVYSIRWNLESADARSSPPPDSPAVAGQNQARR